jgi:ribonuclease Z
VKGRRHHGKGPFHFGAPDGVVVNVTKDDIWVREGVLPDYPNVRAPQFDFDAGQLVVPMPTNKRADIQEPFIREQEVPPADYYPEGYHPQLLSDWPVDEDLVIPVEVMPQQMLAGMGAAWRQRQAYKKHIDELTADS